MPHEIAQSIGPLRKLRARFTLTCLFCVLVIALLAVQVWTVFPLWLNGVLFGAIIVFTWRTFTSYMQYGWWKSQLIFLCHNPAMAKEGLRRHQGPRVQNHNNHTG